MNSNLTILKNEIKIGLKNPISFLHITDSHLTRGDTTGWNRDAHFDVNYKGCKEDYFFEALDYAKKKKLLVVHTGDIIDFFSCENFQIIGEQLKEIDYIYAAGNHDFCHDLAAPKDENYEYKHKHIKEIAPLINSNLLFDSRIVGEVNIVTLDDSYYLISEGQLDMLKAEVSKGYPIILAMHVPFYTEEHAKAVFSVGHKCAWLLGAPKDVLEKYPQERLIQQTPDLPTLKAVEYIKNEPAIKAIIAGHTHHNFEEMLTKTLPQITTHGSFAGYVREITIT